MEIKSQILNLDFKCFPHSISWISWNVKIETPCLVQMKSLVQKAAEFVVAKFDFAHQVEFLSFQPDALLFIFLEHTLKHPPVLLQTAAERSGQRERQQTTPNKSHQLEVMTAGCVVMCLRFKVYLQPWTLCVFCCLDPRCSKSGPQDCSEEEKGCVKGGGATPHLCMLSFTRHFDGLKRYCSAHKKKLDDFTLQPIGSGLWVQSARRKSDIKFSLIRYKTPQTADLKLLFKTTENHTILALFVGCLVCLQSHTTLRHTFKETLSFWKCEAYRIILICHKSD